MKVARISLFDGRVVYTNRLDFDYMCAFFSRFWKTVDIKQLGAGARNQIDVIDMAVEDYAALPASQKADAIWETEAWK